MFDVLIVGPSLSSTVTTCTALAVLPLLSVAVHVTLVVPILKYCGALLVTVTVQLSVVTGVPNEALAEFNVQLPVAALRVTLAGAVIWGLVVSRTVTIAVALVTLPFASVTDK